MPVIELCGSRLDVPTGIGWVIADGAGGSAVVQGNKQGLNELDDASVLTDTPVTVTVNGEEVAQGSGTEVIRIRVIRATSLNKGY